MRKKIISCDPEVMSGTPVFAGTRVPVQTLLEYMYAFRIAKVPNFFKLLFHIRPLHLQGNQALLCRHGN